MEINICDTLNAQINSELWSSYLYLSMSINAEAKGLKGIAKWFLVQSLEELAHAKAFINYMNSTEKKIYLYPIEDVPADWETVSDMFDRALEHEEKISKLIYASATIADEKQDYASLELLTWFINKQTENVNNVKKILFALDAAKENKFALYMLDKELGQRTYQQPDILK